MLPWCSDQIPIANQRSIFYRRKAACFGCPTRYRALEKGPLWPGPAGVGQGLLRLQPDAIRRSECAAPSAGRNVALRLAAGRLFPLGRGLCDRGRERGGLLAAAARLCSRAGPADPGRHVGVAATVWNHRLQPLAGLRRDGGRTSPCLREDTALVFVGDWRGTSIPRARN